MTKQEIFDKVVKHLLTQKKPAMSSGGACAYRGQDNTSCAVGCLIPDDKYSMVIEGVGVLNINVSLNQGHKVLKSILRSEGVDTKDDVTLELLSDLQYLHDGFPYNTWKRELTTLASRFKLNPSVLNDFT